MHSIVYSVGIRYKDQINTQQHVMNNAGPQQIILDLPRVVTSHFQEYNEPFVSFDNDFFVYIGSGAHFIMRADDVIQFECRKISNVDS